MNVFANYAEIYDLLNEAKNYEGEVHFISQLIRQVNPKARSVMNLGCGTGRHDLLLASDDFEMLGVELSPAMLSEAERKRSQARGFKKRLKFVRGDLRTFDAGRQFDALVALFHVLSYQTSENDISAAFETLSRHMAPGSVALFDVWHGPAVESMKPEIRIRRAESNTLRVTRIAEPEHLVCKNIVNVKFTFYVEDKLTKEISSFEELHPMRYFFPTEIQKYAQDKGLTLRETGEWLTRNRASSQSWSVYYLLEKVGA